MRRILIGVAATLGGLVVLAGILLFAFFRTFYPSPPTTSVSGASDVATKQREDFDYFRNYFDLNRTFTVQSRTSAEQLLAQYRERSGSLSDSQFDLGVAQVVALADNGHSRVQPGPLSRRHNRLPCRFYHFDDGYRIIRARPACAELLGAKVLELDGHPIEDIADGMFQYFGGPRNHYDQFASVFFLESPELLNAAGLASAGDRLNLHVLLRDGAQRDVTIMAEPVDATAPRVYSDEYLSPKRIENEPADWVPLLAPDAADHPRAIVLDLRLDQGGNFTTTASLMKNLTKLAGSVEHVYVLTSGWTFSAGIVSVALLKEHNGRKVTLIGEPVGDRIRLWAEGGSLKLPNSGLAIGFATGLHDYSKSCFGDHGCFWTMYLYPMHVQSLDPDIPLPYNFDDYVGLRDPVLERARELARAAQAK